MNPALRSSAAHLFVQCLDAPEPNADDAHHLFRVLRVRDGEIVTVTDGAGRWRVTEVVGRALRPVGDAIVEPEQPGLTIASAIPKGDRAEWMVQKLTEIGVAEIIFLHCARSVVRWEGERGERQLERSRRVAREAAMQSRRVWLPRLVGPETFASIVRRSGVVLAEPSGESPSTLTSVPTTVVIGPEGGFSEDELAVGVSRVRLGATVLRVETAALVAAVTLAL